MKTLMKDITLIAFSILINCFFLIEARSQTWITTYDYENYFGQTMHHDSTLVGPWEMQKGPDNSIFILNFQNQGWSKAVIKIDSSGNLNFRNIVAYHGGIVFQDAKSLFPTNDNGCVYIYTHECPSCDESDAHRLSSNGTNLWTLDYTFPQVIRSIIPTYYNTFLIQHRDWSQNTDSLIEVDSAGHFFRGRSNFNGYIRVLPDSDLVVGDSTGISRQSFNGNIDWSLSELYYQPIFADTSFSFFTNLSINNHFILKVNSTNGNLIWKKSYNRKSVAITSDYGLILTNGNTIEKYDSAGDLQWSRTIPFALFGYSDIIEISPGKYLTGGAYRCTAAPNAPFDLGYSTFFATLDSAGNGVIDSTHGFFVGNANDNSIIGFVDDAAYLGVAMNSVGSPRDSVLNFPGSSSSWTVFAENWLQSFPNGANYKFSDVNGNGVIDTNDVSRISGFYPWAFNVYSHWRIAENNSVPEFKLTIQQDTVVPGDSISARLILGSQQFPLDSVYSIAINLSTGTNLTNSPSIVSITADQFGDTLTNLQYYFNDKYYYGQSDLLLYRVDHQNAVASGDTIAIFKLPIKLTASSGMYNIGFNATALTERGYPVALNFVYDSIYISNTTGFAELNSSPLSIFPNPAYDKIFLQTINDSKKEFKIIDTSGRIVKSGCAEREINIAGLENGVYYIEIISNNKKYQQRIIKQ